MDVITYSLRENGTGSDEYYYTVARFTDEVLAEAETLVMPLVDEYRAHLGAAAASREEHAFELLLLGTLWQAYSDDALGLPKEPAGLLAALADLRQRGGALKPGIDFLRGLLATIFLSSDDHGSIDQAEPTLDHFDRLMTWLVATGEFRQEIRKLKPWRSFFAARGDASEQLATAITFATWFRYRSEAVLGKYTEGVESFLAERYAEHKWREDVIFCGRQRVEYHLNMVGAEIMNLAFRTEFDRRRQKAVLVPGCMRLMPDGACTARPTALGLECQGCVAGCRVHQLSRMGRKYGFAVRILSHESSFSSAPDEAARDLAIVGVACVPNLVAGGWKAQGLGLPAQCVLLDYCGCKSHWDDEGIPTDINLRQLKRVLRIEPAVAPLPVDRTGS